MVQKKPATKGRAGATLLFASRQDKINDAKEAIRQKQNFIKILRKPPGKRSLGEKLRLRTSKKISISQAQKSIQEDRQFIRQLDVKRVK